MHKDVLFDSEMLLTLFTNISVVLFIILYSPLAAANQAAILFTISFISMLIEIIFQLLKKKLKERKKKNLKKIGKIGIFDPLWSDSTAKVKSPLKVPLASLREGEVS